MGIFGGQRLQSEEHKGNGPDVGDTVRITEWLAVGAKRACSRIGQSSKEPPHMGFEGHRKE